MNKDLINRSFTTGYNDICNAFEAAQENDQITLRRCLHQARSLLEEPAIPRYHRIKTLLLLATMVPDVEEALRLHLEADIGYRVIHAQFHNDPDPEIQEGLVELDESIEHLRGILHAEEAPDSDDASAIGDSRFDNSDDVTKVAKTVGGISIKDSGEALTAEEAAAKIIAENSRRQIEAKQQQAEENLVDGAVTGYGTDAAGLKLMEDFTKSKAAPQVKPETATDEQMQQMTHDWQNVVHESLEEVQVQREPAVVDKLKQLGDALSRANFAAYNQHRVALNQIVKEILERRRLQEIKKRAAAPPHKSSPGPNNTGR